MFKRFLKETVSQSELNDIEKFADRLLNKFDVDIEFTKHFADRMNDKRNKPAITGDELKSLFQKMADNKGKRIKKHANSEAILKDIQSDLNLPVVVNWKNGEFEVVNKTIMRKKAFKSPDPQIKYEQNEDNDPCWDSHKQVGTKKKGGKTVPNCVPKEGNKSFKEVRKSVSQMTPAEKKADAEKRKEYKAYQKSKRNESVDEKVSTFTSGHKPDPKYTYKLMIDGEVEGEYQSLPQAQAIVKNRQKIKGMPRKFKITKHPRKKLSGPKGKLPESVNLDEAMGKLNANGEVEMTKAKFAKVHKDYKETDKTGSYVLQHDGKKGTKLFPVKFVKESVDDTIEEVTKKTVRSLMRVEESTKKFLDKTPNWGEDTVIQYGRKKGQKEIGVCGTQHHFGMVLFELDSFDKNYIKKSNVKPGETVFRYATRNTMAGGIFPLVKINIKRGLTYNLTQESSNGDIDEAIFETKGNKLKYLRMLPNWNPKNDSEYTGFEVTK